MIGYMSKRIPIKKPIRLDKVLYSRWNAWVAMQITGGLLGYRRHKAIRCEEHDISNHSLPALISDTSSLAFPRSLSVCAKSLSYCWPRVGQIRHP